MILQRLCVLLFCLSFFLTLKAQEKDEFYRQISTQDSILIQNYALLIHQKPKLENWEVYFAVAKALFNCTRNQEAKAMFFNILDSNNLPYENKIHHYSSLEADSLSYGSYTYDYKNEACLFLTKIEIEDENFQNALDYLKLLEKKYPVQYNCGTITTMYESELRNLRALCYEGLGNTQQAIDLLIPYYADFQNKILIRVLKKQYSIKKIKKHLSIALKSITCEVDSLKSTSYITTNYGLENEETKVINYISGTGKIKLFGRYVSMPNPSLEDGEVVSKQHFIDNFLKSDLYMELSGDYSHSEFPFIIRSYNFNQDN